MRRLFCAIVGIQVKETWWQKAPQTWVKQDRVANIIYFRCLGAFIVAL